MKPSHFRVFLNEAIFIASVMIEQGRTLQEAATAATNFLNLVGIFPRTNQVIKIVT